MIVSHGNGGWDNEECGLVDIKNVLSITKKFDIISI